MIRHKSSMQLSISEFKMPFKAKLDDNNRWVILSKIVPWEDFSRLYYKNFKSNRGAPTKDARLVLGVIIIKHIMKADDRGVIEMIRENPYMQYFLGLAAFTYEPVMTPSLLVSIRKRIDLDAFESLTDDLIRKGLKLKTGSKPDDTGIKVEDADDNEDETPHPGNKGKLQMDATVCDADIKYPTDLDLLNGSRQKAEELIDELCLKLDLQDKPRTYRRVARKDFLNVSKMKRKPANVLRQAIRKQINYLKRDIRSINRILDSMGDAPVPFDRTDMHPSYLGTKPLSSSTPALHRAGGWRGQERTLEKCPGGWQVPVSRERAKPGVPCKICLEVACREHRPPFLYPGTFRERLGGVLQTSFREHAWRDRVPGTIHPQGCYQ